jgi:hypothetical protein
MYPHDVEHHTPSPDLLSRVDHLVYATGELYRGVAEIEQLLGIRASPGGRHSAWRTQNAIVRLGSRCYLEIIAPDPEHPPSTRARPFDLDRDGPSRLVGWAANATELEQLRAAAFRSGVTLGDVQSGSRQRPDGTVLRWTLTDLCCSVADGIIPFFIDWGLSSHPATTAAAGATLVSLRAQHPNAGQVGEMLRAFALPLSITTAPRPALVAEIDCPKGRVLLR